MKAEITTAKTNPGSVGEFITECVYLELVQNFRTKFPSEPQFVNLSRAAIETVLNNGEASGIKFMNGLRRADDPSSRMLILIPGNYTSTNYLPNSIIKRSGFIINTGAAISLQKTWQVLFNHVLNYKSLDPALHYTKINRGAFFGRLCLTELLNSTSCDNFIYHFGYQTAGDLAYKPIIQPASGIKMYIDQSMPCPGSPGCPTGFDPCAITHLSMLFAGHESETQLSVLRNFRDNLLMRKFKGVEIEKYYTISASLMEAISNHQNKEAIFKNLYQKYLKPAVEHLNRNDEAGAYKLFTEVIDHLSNEYLFQ